MSITITRGSCDDVITRLIEGLEAYQSDHPKARIDLYRLDPVSVRIRIVDPDFNKTTRVERNDRVWEYLDRLPDEVSADVSSLILLTPAELPTSFANMEFEDPAPSLL